jgi:hypothetical protein
MGSNHLHFQSKVSSLAVLGIEPRLKRVSMLIRERNTTTSRATITRMPVSSVALPIVVVGLEGCLGTYHHTTDLVELKHILLFDFI